jgi:hypothetical protein
MTNAPGMTNDSTHKESGPGRNNCHNLYNPEVEMSIGNPNIKQLALATALAAIIGPATLAPATSAAVSAHSGASPHLQASPFQSGLAVLLTTKTVILKVQRTVHFTGYATYTFAAPRGRRIVKASARISGAEVHAVRISGQSISHNNTRYSVKLVFPNEQGNPGKLTVRLSTVA